MLEGREVRELSALNMRANDAPAGRRDDFVFVERRLPEAEGVGELQVLLCRNGKRLLAELCGAFERRGVPRFNRSGLCGRIRLRHEGGSRAGCAGGEEVSACETGHSNSF